MSSLTEIRNNQGKLVCRIDKPSKTIEIAIKGCVCLSGGAKRRHS